MSHSTITVKSMNSRLGACVVLHASSNDVDEGWIEVTLSPEEAEQLVKMIQAAKEDALTQYGRKSGHPRKSPFV